MTEIYLGGGCFWGVEAYYQKIKGITQTEVGYANGNIENVTYEEVCRGSGHVEVVKISFDETVLSLSDFFDSFMHIIDPFTINRQGNDFGIQYRSGMYTKDDNILIKLSNLLKNWESKNSKTKIEIKSLLNYTKAEIAHQNYLLKNQSGYCHINLNDIPKGLGK